MMSRKIRSLQTPSSRAHGLGSARQGSDHWWKQRLTSIALVPLGIWFMFSMATLVGADQGEVKEWLSSPFSATLMVLFIGIACHHTASGIEVVLEDYVHIKWIKVTAMITQKLFFLVLAVACTLSVLKLFLGGA